MPIMSYLVYPAPGKRDELQVELSAIPGCETIAAKNEDLIVLVTETPGEEAERRLQERLSKLPTLRFLAMVSGFEDAVPSRPRTPQRVSGREIP